MKTGAVISGSMPEPKTCSEQALVSICHRAQQAMTEKCETLGVIVLPGSFNPVHSEHVRSLELARQHLEQKGVAVVGGFLQPSSDSYVTCKLGPEWAMSLEDRITACELAVQASVVEQDGEVWVHAWRSGQTNGFEVPIAIEEFLNASVSQKLDVKLPGPITAYMVCGADLVERCGGWDEPEPFPVVVLKRPGIALPTSAPAVGWEVADGEMKPVSSTRIREAIGSNDWNQLVEEGCHPRVVEFMRARHKDGKLFNANAHL